MQHSRKRGAHTRLDTVALCLAIGAALVGFEASAQEDRWESWETEAEQPDPGREDSRARDEERADWSIRGSLGLTASPETFNMTLEVPWHATELFSVGPLVQLGFADDHVLFATTAQAYLTPKIEGDLDRWQPYASLGIGFIHLTDDDRRAGRDDEDTEFLLTLGTGVDVRVGDEGWALGTGFLFNTIPGGAVGNRFVWAWQMLTLRKEF